MPVLKNISYLATCKDEGGQGDIYPIKNAAVVWQDEFIQWVGNESDLPEEYAEEEPHDAKGKMVIPGLVDCHTHLAFGGWRPNEFAMRVGGESYLDIAKSGGGILSTVKATRAASEDELYKKAAGFLDEMVKLGLTTVECKSGYGLSVEDELKTLCVYRRLAEEQPVDIVSTFLGAHTLPPEFNDNRQGYIKLITEEIMPAVAEEGLARICEVLAEGCGFSIV